jgi:hypothetical protein
MMNIELRIDGRTVVNGSIDTAVLQSLLASVQATPSVVAQSTTMTAEQAEDLLASIDAKSAHFLKQIAANNGVIEWEDVKAIFGISGGDDDGWGIYAGGFGKGITRAVRRIVDDKAARLIWWRDTEWNKDVKRLYVDGPALEALRRAASV